MSPVSTPKPSSGVREELVRMTMRYRRWSTPPPDCSDFIPCGVFAHGMLIPIPNPNVPRPFPLDLRRTPCYGYPCHEYVFCRASPDPNSNIGGATPLLRAVVHQSKMLLSIAVLGVLAGALSSSVAGIQISGSVSDVFS